MRYASLCCLKCGRGFEPMFAGEGDYPNLDGGLLFRAPGQYGSRAYDPGTGGYLVIAVCDGCLAEEGRIPNVIEASPSPEDPPPPRLSAWDPDRSPYEAP